MRSLVKLGSLSLVSVGFRVGHESRWAATKEDLVNDATARLTLQDFREVIDPFNATLRLDPEEWALWNGRGTARSALNDFSDARADSVWRHGIA